MSVAVGPLLFAVDLCVLLTLFYVIWFLDGGGAFWSGGGFCFCVLGVGFGVCVAICVLRL